MTDSELDGPRLAPASGGAAKQLVILLHGYGADGNDLIGLGQQWAPLLPDAAFVAPNAPNPCAMSPMGREWFPLDFTNAEDYEIGVAAAKPLLAAFIDKELARHGLGAKSLALVGFSQGTMMALAIGLAREEPPAAILGYSGALTGADLSPNLRNRPPRILLIHGDQDPVIPIDAMTMARQQLGTIGLTVESHICTGLGHGIDSEGLMLGGGFLKQSFQAAAQENAPETEAPSTEPSKPGAA